MVWRMTTGFCIFWFVQPTDMGHVPTLQPFVSVAFFNFFVPLKKCRERCWNQIFWGNGLCFFFREKKFKCHPGVMWDRKFLIEDNNRGEVSWNSWFSKFGAIPIICPKKASHNERCGRFWELQLVSEWFPGYVIVDNGWLWKKIGSKAVSA